jgi:hypothetical protein
MEASGRVKRIVVISPWTLSSRRGSKDVDTHSTRVVRFQNGFL